MMKTEYDRKKIREFLDLLENEKYDHKIFTKPVLVYFVDENKKVKYSIFEHDLLMKFGLENVDGWDHEDDIVFAPDWVQESNDDDDDFDDDDDDFDDDDLCAELTSQKKKTNPLNEKRQKPKKIKK